MGRMRRNPQERTRTITRTSRDGSLAYTAIFEALGARHEAPCASIEEAQHFLNSLEDVLDATYGLPD
jgi:hypothetical protein